jgi:DNA-binding NarL/FixJ family response regulator
MFARNGRREMMGGGVHSTSKHSAEGRPARPPSGGRIRVLIADDHDVILLGLTDLLNSNHGCEVVSVARTGREAVAKACETRPDVAVLDINMPVLNGVEATREIRKAVPKTEVLILTAYDSEQLALATLQAGARGYLLKSDTSRELVAAVKSLRAGRPFFSTPLARTILDGYLQAQHAPAEGPYRLTKCEREVLQLLAEGYSNKGVASKRGIALKTVETHRSNIMRKLKLRSIVDIVRFAVRNEIIQA